MLAAELNYAHIERKALAIIFEVIWFINQYLYGHEFVSVTDYRPLCKFFGQANGVQPLVAAQMQHWAMILSAYSYRTEYVPGWANQCADCLSHLPTCRVFSRTVHAMHTTNPAVTATEIAKHTAKGKVSMRVFTYMRHNS